MVVKKKRGVVGIATVRNERGHSYVCVLYERRKQRGVGSITLPSRAFQQQQYIYTRRFEAHNTFQVL